MKLLGKAQDKAFWSEVRTKDCYKNFVDEALNLYNKNKFENGVVPSICYDDYKLYFTTGDRGIYEGKYFRKRVVLNTSAVLSMIFPENEEYLHSLQNIIFAICDEYSWCLPAHQKILEVNNNSKIDLFASETGETLSEIYTILGDRLDPLIRNRIIAEIDRRIITPFINSEKYDWWELGNMNWTAVCMGSVGCSMMLMRPELMNDKMIARFDASMNTFLSGFSSEGFCLEGAGYWDYGFGFFTVFADMLKTFTNGKVDYFKLDKVRAIATFIQKMFLSENASVSFADGGRTIRYRLSILHRLKDEYPDDILVYPPEYSFNHDSCGRWCLYVRCLCWLNEEYLIHPAHNPNTTYFASNAEWFIKRTANYGFATKGGNNDEHHNHNDIGSFIFAKNGEQILCDLGSGKYCRQYFSPERYSFLETSSRGHSVPIFNGNFQKFGKQYKAKNTKFEDGVFTTDISGAYGIDDFKSCVRSFSFKEESVTLTDDFDFVGDAEVSERFISVIAPTVFDGYIKIKDSILTYSNGAELTVNEVKDSREHPVYLIDFKLKEGVKKFTLNIK